MIKLEPVGPANTVVFKDIRLRALQESPTAFSAKYADKAKLTESDWLDRAAQWSSDKSAAYLAIDSGAPVGIAAGILDGNNPLHANLMSMWVAPTHRRLGIGRILVDAIISWARVHNVLHLHLMVTSNNDRAMQFYQRLGFTRTGRSQTYRNDASLLDYEMRRPLL
ncbi:MAG TPA: GNAT family N-acetyltransferase [Candidatus Limnocylindrales bacterium]|nr:GNAT family N-acetyltransferase [Candidatus Limnocylindrales bacterium]